LIRVVTGLSRADVVAGVELSRGDEETIVAMMGRRADGEPLQYLEGTALFGPIEVAVDHRVLIPRPETEQLWERAMDVLSDGPGIVVDVGTGSGCIALAIKQIRPDLRVLGVDVSAEALEVASHNANVLGLDIELRHGDLLAALDEADKAAINLIVSNPPYISNDDWERLPVDVRDHEPRLALVAEHDGLAFYERLAIEARPWLHVDGILVAEIGETQGSAVAALFEASGWTAVVSIDLTGRDRFVEARR